MAPTLYNRGSMNAAWAKKIEHSQQQPFYTEGGTRHSRIRYGDEDPSWGQAPCTNCAVVRGQFHVTAECGFETCPKCGGSIGGHTCSFEEFVSDDMRPSSAQKSPSGRELRAAIYWVVLLGLLASLRALGLL